MRRDNTVNMDTRTVLSGLRLEGDGECTSTLAMDLFASESAKTGVMTLDDVLHRLSELKSRYELVVEKIPLRNVTDWTVTPTEIVHKDRKYFRVLGVNVTIENREVAQWCQPIVQPLQEGLCVLFAKKIKGVLHFLLQAKVECGNFDVVEFAPTIQCLTGSWTNPQGYVPEFLNDFLSGAIIDRVLFDTKQSEEGGRFYHEQNRNVICLVNDRVPDVPAERFVWLTLGQI